MGLDGGRVSNAMGVPINQWIINQLNERSKQIKATPRDTDNIIYQANKTAWIRMVSSVDIDSAADLKYYNGLVTTGITNPSDLAKKFVLQGGTSIYNNENGKVFYQQRGGLSEAYNVAGSSEVSEYGYRPMPGITSVKVTTQGKMGSLRSADIQIKVWDKHQLDIIDALFFKLGYTMFLEWGHTNYYDANTGKLEQTEALSIDPFAKELTKEKIFNYISKNVISSQGNYDAMLGMVTNFNFSYNQEGGYDCTIKLMALGVLASGIKINNPKPLPDIRDKIIKLLVDTLIRSYNQQSIDELKDDPASPYYYPPCIRNRGNIVSYVGGGLKQERLKDYAISAQVNGQYYFFYRSNINPDGGDWQTTGYNSRGGWYCDGDSLYINNKNTDLEYKTYQEILESSDISKIYVPYQESNLLTVLTSGGQVETKLGLLNLDKPYINKIINGGDEYLAFNKFKALVPTNPKNYDITATLKLPTLTVIKSQIQRDGTISEFSSPLSISKTLLEDGKYNEITTIDRTNQIIYSLTNQFNPISVLTYTNRAGGEIHNYAITLDYPGIITNSGARRSASAPGGWDTSSSKYVELRYATRPSIQTENGEKVKEIQEKILETLNSDTDFWKIDEIEENEMKESQVIANLQKDGRVPKITVTLSKTITLTYKTKQIPDSKDASGRFNSETDPISTWKDIDTKFPIKIIIKTTDLGIISSLDIKPNSELQRASDAIDQTSQNTQQIDTASSSEEALNISDIQKSEALKYQSTFEVMIRTIQLYSLNNAIEIGGIEKEYPRVSKLDLTNSFHYENFTKGLFSVGLFSNTLSGSISGYTSTNTEKECNQYDTTIDTGTMTESDMIKLRSKFGFNFSLMGNKVSAKKLLGLGGLVNYSELMTTYTVPYKVNIGVFEGTQVNHPVYVKLGFVLMIINHICSIYDVKKDDKNTTPLVYFDFNHNTNICLSNAKQLSTNPYDILIPFEGTNEDFKLIIDPAVVEGDNIKAVEGSTATPIFKPEDKDTGDRLSSELPKFKIINSSDRSAHRGRTMNILVSTDYLLRTVASYTKQDQSNDIYAKEFVEQILFDINKYLGDFNMFRLAYDDSGNTMHITDDQMSPNLENEYIETNKTEFPLFGLGSLARSLEIRTEISSKLSNMIAISANSNRENLSSLSKTSDSFGFYNLGYRDRYVKDRGELKSESSKVSDATINSAIQFNKAIETYYSDTIIAETSVSHATNYFIQRMSKIKGEEKGTRASAVIPVSLNFSTDGISGLGMGQAFTISQQFLPQTYDINLRNPYGEQDKVNTVGFVVVGLDQTIEGNQWISNVRANMMFLKKAQDFEQAKLRREIAPSSKGFKSTQASGYSNTNFVGKNNEAKLAAETYLESTLTDSAWSELVSATFAEASRKQVEEAAVMGVILNRVRTNFGNYGSTVYGQLRGLNQFESVTGKNTSNFVKGPSPSAEISIYGAAERLLSLVPKTYKFFTSANRSLFYDENGKKIEGRDTANYDNAVKNYKLIGGSYFG